MSELYPEECNEKIGEDIHPEKGLNLKQIQDKIMRERKKEEKPKIHPKQVFGKAYKEPKKK